MAAILVVVAFAFVSAETVYFGWHMNPESTPEAVCDTVAALLVLAAILCEIAGV